MQSTNSQVVILGAGGMLGHDLMRAFPRALGFDITPEFNRKRRLDITVENEIRKKLQQINPQLVINAAAYTDVDGAETDRTIAKKVNSDAVLYLSKACADLEIRFVHFSTDYVFDGNNPQGYAEDTPTNPINWYGATKAEGESYIQQNLSDYYIIRTSWLFGKYGRNFVYTILKLAGKGDPLRVVDDQIGCPTYSRDLATEVRQILSEKPGIYHVTNQGHCSWFEFAKKIIEEANLASQVEIIPIGTSDFPRAAQRPKFSILQSTKRINKTGSWQEALRDFLIDTREI